MKKNLKSNRRNFIKGSVVGAGALATGLGAGLILPGGAKAQDEVLPYPFTKPDPVNGLIDLDLVTREAYEGYLGTDGALSSG